MRDIIFLSVLLALVACGKSNSREPVMLVDKKVLFLGNSITQNGAYVSYIEYYLRQKYPGHDVDIISIGLSSETVSCLTEEGHPYPRPCLRERLKSALTKVQPDVVVACYGMNDGIYHPQSSFRLKQYKEGIHELLEQVEKTDATAVLVTPPIFDPLPIAAKVVDSTATVFGYAHPYEDYDEVLSDYSRWLNSLEGPDLRVVDLHSAMKAYVKKRRLKDPSFSFAADGIHPSDLGHLFMAQQFLKEFGFSFDKDLQAEDSKIRSDRLFQLTDQRRKLRSDGWLKYIGYVRGDTVKQASIDETELRAGKMEGKILNLGH